MFVLKPHVCLERNLHVLLCSPETHVCNKEAWLKHTDKKKKKKKVHSTERNFVYCNHFCNDFPFNHLFSITLFEFKCLLFSIEFKKLFKNMFYSVQPVVIGYEAENLIEDLVRHRSVMVMEVLFNLLIRLNAGRAVLFQ